MIGIATLLTVVPLLGAAVAVPAYSQDEEQQKAIREEACKESGDIFCNPIKYNSLEDLLLGAFDAIVTIILIPIMTLSIVFIGFKMVLAGVQGNSEAYAKLKKSFGYAMIGLFVVLAVKGILEVIKNTVGTLLA